MVKKKIINTSKVKLKKGDTVVVQNGTDKNKKGKILQVLRKENKVLIQGVNVRTKHVKAKKQGQESGIIKSESAINISKVSYFCDKCDRGVKLGTKLLENGEKFRVCRKCGEEKK